MANKKKNIILILFIVAIILTTSITAIVVNNINKKNENKTNEINTINHEKNLENNKEKHDEIKDENNKETTHKQENNNQKDDIVIKEYKENDIINYANEISKTDNKDKLKEGFVTIIDFLFYDGKIYNKTFNELSNSAKIKIIALAIRIDNKMDELFPDYKDKISANTNKIYINLKTKIVALYLDTTVKICSNNSALCKDAKTGLNELKDSSNITWDFIKDISGVGINKLKNWYEVWREE